MRRFLYCLLGFVPLGATIGVLVVIFADQNGNPTGYSWFKGGLAGSIVGAFLAILTYEFPGEPD